MQEWVQHVQTKTARHKLAKYLKEHSALLTGAWSPASPLTWLRVECADRPGLLADIALVIAAHSHNIKVCV